MKVEKKKIKVPCRKLIKNAFVEEVDTGDLREQTIYKENGERIVERKPIKRRVFHEPVFEERSEDKEVFSIKSKTGEEHLFANEEDARRFIRDTEARKK